MTNYIRLTKQEKNLLREKLNWIFFDEFLKQVENNNPAPNNDN